MSAVSSESPRSSADLTEHAGGRASARPASPADHDEESQPPPPAQAAADQATTDFGPNEWLVDELYQRYQADPSSVDRAWWNFFADYHPLPAEPRTAARPGGAAAGDRAGSGPPATGLAAGQAQPGQPRAASPATGPANGPGPGQDQGPPPGKGPRPGQGQAAPASGARAGGTAGGAAPGGPAGARPPGAGPAQGGTHAAADARATGEPAAGVTEVRLRGAAARTAANMAASLVVPTATSVRAIPAKLLIDNRIVINNHLARGRGGKVSFTHLIGYAIVKALGR